MGVEINKVMDAMSLPIAFRDRPRYQEMARILAHFADKVIEKEIADEERILNYWFKLRLTYNSSTERKIYMNVPADTPSEGLAKALIADLGDGFFDEHEESFAEYLNQAGVTFPLPEPEESSSPPINNFNLSNPIDLVELSCSKAPLQSSERLTSFVDDVWEAREALAAMTAPQMAQHIYDNIYTELSEPDKNGNLEEEGLNYLDSLRGVGGETKKLTVIGKKGEPIRKAIVPEWITVGAASDVAQRVYVNVKAECAPEAMQAICDLMEKNENVPHAKVAGPLDAGKRPDTIVVYTKNEAASKAVVGALQGNVREACFQKRIPALTYEASKGIGVADNPQERTGQSFGQTRSSLVAEAVHDLLVTVGVQKATLQDFQEATAQYFLLNGLDPERPHQDYADSYPDLTKPPPEAIQPAPKVKQKQVKQKQVKQKQVKQKQVKQKRQFRLTEEEVAQLKEKLKEPHPPPVPSRKNKPPGKLSSPIAGKLENILADQLSQKKPPS